MKKQIKILSVIVLIIFTLFVLRNVVNADTGDMISSLSEPTYADTDEIVDIGEKIVGIIQIIGTVVAIVILAVLGLKYLTSSIEEKANIKGAMIPYIVGAVLIFSTTTIVNVVYSLVMKVNNNNSTKSDLYNVNTVYDLSPKPIQDKIDNDKAWMEYYMDEDEDKVLPGLPGGSSLNFDNDDDDNGKTDSTNAGQTQPTTFVPVLPYQVQ